MSEPSGSSDAELVKRAIEGEQEAFKELMNRYVKVAGAIAFSVVGDYYIAADVVNEAFMKAYVQLANLRDPAHFKTYLAGTVKTTALDYVRRKETLKRGRTVTFTECTGESQDAPVPGELVVEPSEFEQKEIYNKVMQLVNELPPQYREVFLLKHLEDLTYREIADILSITPNAVEARLFRARQMLKKRMEDIL